MSTSIIVHVRESHVFLVHWPLTWPISVFVYVCTFYITLCYSILLYITLYYSLHLYTVYMCHIFSHAHVLSQLLRPTACLACFLLFSAITASPGCLVALGSSETFASGKWFGTIRTDSERWNMMKFMEHASEWCCWCWTQRWNMIRIDIGYMIYDKCICIQMHRYYYIWGMQGRILKEYQAPCFTEVTITCSIRQYLWQVPLQPPVRRPSRLIPLALSGSLRLGPSEPEAKQRVSGTARRGKDTHIYIYIHIINVYTSARKADWTVRQGNLMQFRPSWYFDSIDSFGQTSHSSSMNSGWPGEHSWSRKFRVVLSQEPGKSGRPSTTQRQGWEAGQG